MIEFSDVTGSSPMERNLTPMRFFSIVAVVLLELSGILLYMNVFNGIVTGDWTMGVGQAGLGLLCMVTVVPLWFGCVLSLLRPVGASKRQRARWSFPVGWLVAFIPFVHLVIPFALLARCVLMIRHVGLRLILAVLVGVSWADSVAIELFGLVPVFFHREAVWFSGADVAYALVFSSWTSASGLGVLLLSTRRASRFWVGSGWVVRGHREPMEEPMQVHVDQ